MSKWTVLGPLLLLLSAASASGDQQLVAARVDQAPSVDGSASDAAWTGATAITTRDNVTGLRVVIKSVYTADEIFFLVQFPDEDETRHHKTMHWDAAQERYRTGSEREDTFVFKWSMEPHPVDLSLSADNPYRADVWYWKSHRTDHAGHADDKLQVYSLVASSRAKKLRSRNGTRFYLSRRGDEGEAAYQSILYDSFVNDNMPKYRLRKPGGSRADIQAKGAWNDGVWTIEFRRRLNTGNGDDVQFDPSRSYQFGTSCFEIAGRKPDPKINKPHFGSGEVGERLKLTFG